MCGYNGGVPEVVSVQVKMLENTVTINAIYLQIMSFSTCCNVRFINEIRNFNELQLSSTSEASSQIYFLMALPAHSGPRPFT
jgi:hypothetical protein